MKKFILLIPFFYILSFSTNAQVNTGNFKFTDSTFQFGVSAKLALEFPFKAKKHKIKYRFSIGAGIGSRIEGIRFMYPSLHAELQFYNRGIGASLEKIKNRNLDFILSPTITVGCYPLNADSSLLELKYVPLYYFSELSANPLQNTFYHSFSVGTNLIIPHYKTMKENDDKVMQRVGFINFMIARWVQVSYYNYGGAPLKWLKLLGDGKDRYYSGGILFSYHGYLFTSLNLAELGYHKFTGWVNEGFEAATELGLDFVPYKDYSAFYYNKSIWKLNLVDMKYGLGGSLFVYNPKFLDLQNGLHFIGDMAYHPSYNQRYYGMGFYYKPLYSCSK